MTKAQPSRRPLIWTASTLLAVIIAIWLAGRHFSARASIVEQRYAGTKGLSVKKTNDYTLADTSLYRIIDLNRDEGFVIGETNEGHVLETNDVFRQLARTVSDPFELAERYEWARGSGASPTRKSVVLTVPPPPGTDTYGRPFAPPVVRNFVLVYSMFEESRLDPRHYSRGFADVVTGLGDQELYSVTERTEHESWKIVGDAVRIMLDGNPVAEWAPKMNGIVRNSNIPSLRYFALIPLRKTEPTPETTQLLRDAVKDPSALVRVGAAEALWISNTSDAREVVRVLARDDMDPVVRDELRFVNGSAE